MRLLLDTQLFLWVTTDSRKLSRKTRAMIASADAIAISAVSVVEAAIKSSIGKLKADPEALAAAIATTGFRELPVTVAHAARLGTLPLLHRDPFDRLLIAQALCEQLSLVTTDALLASYSDSVLLV